MARKWHSLLLGFLFLILGLFLILDPDGYRIAIAALDFLLAAIYLLEFAQSCRDRKLHMSYQERMKGNDF